MPINELECQPTMLTQSELDHLYLARNTPQAGQLFIERIRSEGPAWNVQKDMDTIRTQLNSEKMGRKVYAKKRDVQLPAIVAREQDPETIEFWPQPCIVDLHSKSKLGNATRSQCRLDLFVVTTTGFEIEWWKTESELHRLSLQRPECIFREDSGIWRHKELEDHFAGTGIVFRLRSTDEHPHILLRNVGYTADYAAEDAVPPPAEEKLRLRTLLEAHHRFAFLTLVYEHQFKAEHLLRFIVDGVAFVDLKKIDLTDVEKLVVHENRTHADIYELIKEEAPVIIPDSHFTIEAGAKFNYEHRTFEIADVESEGATCKQINPSGMPDVFIPHELLSELFHSQQLQNPAGSCWTPKREDLKGPLHNAQKLNDALRRLKVVREMTPNLKSRRSRQRWAKRIEGINATTAQIEALLTRTGGNFARKVPDEAIDIAVEVLNEFHNKPNCPKKSASYTEYTTRCEKRGVKRMQKSSFYEWIKKNEDILKREGARAKYAQDPIPLWYDHRYPLEGILPHEIVYIDHTPLSVLCKGINLPDLGKPILTLAMDGGMAKARAFYLSYRQPSIFSFFGVIRDYVLRNKRLPKMIVLDNGREFIGNEVSAFCEVFGIKVRWRRRSKPRDSSVVERMLGATEDEVVSALEANTVKLKHPRMVSSTHDPRKFISWTLPALHGSIEHYLFRVHPNRKHPRWGVSPNQYEARTDLERGKRERSETRFDQLFAFLTSPHPTSGWTRVIDPARGVFVDGVYFWNDAMAFAKKGETAEIRVELWHASVVYVRLQDNWYYAHARDNLDLNGRTRYEYETQLRQERRRKRTEAAQDRNNPSKAAEKALLWQPKVWDERLREQASEESIVHQKAGINQFVPRAPWQAGHVNATKNDETIQERNATDPEASARFQTKPSETIVAPQESSADLDASTAPRNPEYF